MEPVEARRPHLWRAGIVAAITLLFLFPVVRLYQPTLDEGTFVDGAVRILAGQLPYRDFIEPAAPGSFYWIALWFRLFGASFETARTLLLLTGLALVLLTFALSRRLGGQGWCAAGFVLITSVPLMTMNSPHYDSTVLVLAAVLVYLSRRFALAGFLLGVADVCMQGKGLYVAIALAVCLLLSQERKAVLKLLGLWTLPLLATGVWFSAHHALADALYSTVWWPFTSYGPANRAPYAFPLLDDLHRWWALLLPRGSLIALAICVLLGTPFFLAAGLPLVAPAFAFATRTWQKKYWVVWCAAFALFASELHRHDLGHLLNGSPLLMILFCTCLETAAAKWPRFLLRFVVVSIALYLSAQFFSATSETARVHGRRGTLRGQQGAGVLAFLATHTRAGEPVFFYPYRPVFYFWGAVRNPTRYTLLMYGYNTDAQFHEAVRALDREKVRFVFWDEQFGPVNARAVFPEYVPPPPGKLILEPYLIRRYHKVVTVEGFSVMERNP